MIKLEEKENELPSDDYIMGFVEGEGCFSCSIEKYTDHRPRLTGRCNRKHWAFPFRVMPSFRLTIAKKDSRVLRAIRKRLGYGEIYTRKQSKKARNWQDACQYYVQTRLDLFKIAEYFKKQRFYTTKERDFKLWCQILEIIRQNRERTKEGFLEICHLRDQMNKIKGKTHKRTTRKIKAILENPPEHIAAHRKQCSVVYITNPYTTHLENLEKSENPM